MVLIFINYTYVYMGVINTLQFPCFALKIFIENTQ